jgi:cell division protein FtsZ
MAIGEGKGRSAAEDAVQSALANPLFDAPLRGSKGILFNVRGGKDLTIGQVHQVAGVIREAAQADTQVIFGVVQDRKFKKRVRITLVATGIVSAEEAAVRPLEARAPRPVPKPSTNGHQRTESLLAAQKLL